MAVQKRWSFGFGSVFGLIVVYFIFLYSKDRGWSLLAFVSKWYLIIVGGIMLLSFAIIVLVFIFGLIVLTFAKLKFRNFRKKKAHKEYIDAEYKFKD